jgi:integrase
MCDGENPIARVQRQRVQAYGKAVALTPAAVRHKLQAIDRSALDGQRDHALLAIALQTGRRLAEIAALTWSDLRLHDDGRATIIFQRCKGGKTMRDTIPPALTRTLLGWLQAFYGQQLGDLPADAPLWVSLATNGTHGKRLRYSGAARSQLRFPVRWHPQRKQSAPASLAWLPAG